MNIKLSAILFSALTIILFILTFSLRVDIFFWLAVIFSLVSLYLIFKSLKIDWKNFKASTKGGIIGFIIGIILATINSFPFLGFLGAFFYSPFSKIFATTICSGEGCWLWLIIVGDIGFIFFGFLIGWIVGKVKSRNKTVVQQNVSQPVK